MEEFFKGLSPEDAKLAADDIMFFGTAFVQEVDGVKRRIAPSDIIIHEDGTVETNGNHQ